MSAFLACFNVTVGHEGGFTKDERDPGNWTGGKCGAGELRGTKRGISAGSYPDLNIEYLTDAEIEAIYRRDYWDQVGGDDLPLPLALLVFDAAVNCGVSQSARWLQEAVGFKGRNVDGRIGPETLRAVANRQGHGVELMIELLTKRALFCAGLATWRTYGRGWLRRMFALAYQSVRLGL